MLRHLLSFSNLVVFALSSASALAQGSPAPPTTPLEWTRQVRRSVPAAASFYYEVAYYDANRQVITDTLIAEIDAKRVRLTRRDKRTNAPVGMTKSYHWPSMRPSAEGAIVTIGGQDRLIGRWTYWYDHAPKENNKEREIIYDASGNPVPGTEKRYEEKKLGCKYVPYDALANARNKLTCQTCFGSSRTVVPVELETEATSIIIAIDIRDEKKGLVNLSTVASLGAAYATGGTSAMAQGGAAVLTSIIGKMKADNASVAAPGTNCLYYITTDGAAAQKWYNTKGKAQLNRAAIIYSSVDNPSSETRLLQFTMPLKHFFVCVENWNIATGATLTLSVTATRQECE